MILVGMLCVVSQECCGGGICQNPRKIRGAFMKYDTSKNSQYIPYIFYVLFLVP